MSDLQQRKEKALSEISRATDYARRYRQPAENFENWWKDRWQEFSNCEDVSFAMRKYIHYAFSNYYGG